MDRRTDYRNATAAAADSLWRAKRCRFAARDPRHQCTNAFGAPAQPGQVCNAEARAQIADERAAS